MTARALAPFTRALFIIALGILLLVLVPTAPVHAEEDSDGTTCAPLPESALKQIGFVMDLVQAQKAQQALALADQVVREHPCHVSYQARASCEQLLRKHRMAIDDFRRAYGLVKESYDLEGIARSAIAVGDLDLAARVSRALRAFKYKSEPERQRGMRCVKAIAAAANMLIQSEQDAAHTRPVPVAHVTARSEEGE